MDHRMIALAASVVLLANSAADAAGELHIFNWGNYTNPDLLKKFEKTYDVRVTLTDYDSNDTALAKIRQGGHGFDIALPSQNYLPIWIEEGLVLETNPGQMENAKNIAPEWADPEFDPGRRYSAPYAWGTVGIAIDTADYSGDINTWKLIFDPPDELKGRINVVPEMNDVLYAAIAFHGGKSCDGDMDLLRKVRDTLVAAKAHWLTMQYDTIDKMVAGDFVASTDWNGAVLRMRLQKPSIRYGYPVEGFQYWSDNIVVLKDARNVENAKLFQNFVMDPENAALISSFNRYANAITGSEAFMPEDMATAPEVIVPEEFRAYAEYSVVCPPEVQQLYTRIWTELQK
jgi:spermidine/putrescine transport system substrate-binding protein